MSSAPLHRVIVGEDSEEESDEAVYEHPASKADSEAGESDEDREALTSSDSRELQPDEENGDTWRQKMKPSIESAIERIQELMMNQKELLSRVSARDGELTGNERIGKINATMTKCTAYAQKVDRLIANMVEISSVIERIKTKADDLRVDAQSYAIKKEEKREERQQWNLFYAARPSESVSSD